MQISIAHIVHQTSKSNALYTDCL